MNILIMGDSHNQSKFIRKTLEKEKDSFDYLIHTGDLAGHRLNHLTNSKGLDESIELLIKNNAKIVRGNHDLCTLQRYPHLISSDAKTFLSDLPNHIILEEFPYILFQHSQPSGIQALPTKNKFEREINEMKKYYEEFEIIFHGHSHVSSITSGKKDSNEFRYIVSPKTDKTILLSKDYKHVVDVGIIFNFTPGRLFNPPRYVILDTNKREIVYKRA